MNLFQYILLPFGLSVKYKTLDQILTGISFSIFGLMIIITVSILASDAQHKDFYKDTGFYLKLSSLVIEITGVWAYALLKSREQNFNGMFEAILAFERNKCRQRISFGHIWFGTASLLFIVSYVTYFYAISRTELIRQIYRPLQNRLLFDLHVSITGLYF